MGGKSAAAGNPEQAAIPPQGCSRSAGPGLHFWPDVPGPQPYSGRRGHLFYPALCRRCHTGKLGTFKTSLNLWNHDHVEVTSVALYEGLNSQDVHHTGLC